MKKLGLKPLGDLRGKFGMGWLFIGLIMAFCVSACSDDDDDTVTPVFPAKQTINCNVGETKELSFDANTSWQLTSSATWCRFVVDGEEEYSLSGDAGKQNITLKVTGEAQQNEGISIAQLTLIMGNGRATIADVVRSAEGYELKIFDANGQEINQIEVGCDDYISFKVKANFRFAATNRPDWVEVAGGSIVGAVNKEVTGGVKIIQNGQVEKYPVAASNDNVLTFAAEDGKGFFSFPVVYKGMKPETIVVSKPSTNAWGWTVSLDGKNFAQQSGGVSGGSSLSYRYRVPFTIKALNDDYVMVYMEEWKDFSGQVFISPIEEGMEWMHCKGTNGAVTVTVDPFEPWGAQKERTGYVLAFSRAEYETIKHDLEGIIVQDGEIYHKYEQSNLLIAFTQKEVEQAEGNKGFVIKEYGYLDVASEKCTDSAILNFLKMNYTLDADKVFSMAGTPGSFYSVNPLFTEDEWYGEAYAFDVNGNDIAGVVLEGGADQEGNMTLGVSLPEAVNTDVIIYFSKVDGTGKALVMTINN